MEKDQDRDAKEVKEIPSGKQAVLIQKEEEEEFSTESLRGNDTKVLELLNQEGSNYSFKGIMRRLGIHQQSLARALRRLEEIGLIEKSSIGYQLSKAGQNTATARIEPKGKEYMQLLQTYIPVEIKPAEIVCALVGRWFRNLRWAGLIESPTGFMLQWSSEDGSFQINLRTISDYIVIETNASTEREKLESMIGSYAIYEQIGRVLQERLVPGNSYIFRSPAVNN